MILKASSFSQDENSGNITPFVIVAFLSTLFLFYIDEGNYSLKGITQVGNIIALSIYWLGLILGQVLVKSFLYKQKTGYEKTALVIVTGLPIGLFLAIGMIFLFGLIRYTAM